MGKWRRDSQKPDEFNEPYIFGKNIGGVSSKSILSSRVSFEWHANEFSRALQLLSASYAFVPFENMENQSTIHVPRGTTAEKLRFSFSFFFSLFPSSNFWRLYVYTYICMYVWRRICSIFF